MPQTSGTTNLADSPILHLYPDAPGEDEGPIFSDLDPARVVSTLRTLDEAASYAQRTTDLAVISLGQEIGVPTCIVTLPMLYGRGLGAFNTHTGQVTALIRQARKDGYVSVVGDGGGVKCHVHIEDAGRLFERLVSRVLDGEHVPAGEEGILFVESGWHRWRDVGAGLASAGVRLGQLGSENVKSLRLDEAVEKLDWHDRMWTELAFVSR